MQPVNLTCHTDRTELAFHGTLDVSGTRAAYGALNEALTRALPLALDTAELERVDAAGLQLLFAFCQVARARHVKLRWQSVGPAVAASAELLGLSAELELPR